MYKYIYSTLKYPKEAFENKITGHVIVQFSVGKDGTISNARVTRGIGYGCDEEALRVAIPCPSNSTSSLKDDPTVYV